MAVADVAQGLTNLCKGGQFDEAMTKYYAPDIVSVEAGGPQPETRGMAGVQAKAKWFEENFEVHGLQVDGPYVSGDQFVVRFSLETTEKSTGKRSAMTEVGVYTVKDGKVVHERFFPLTA